MENRNRQDKNEKKEDDNWDFISSVVGFIKDFIVIFLGDSVSPLIALLIATLTSVITNLSIYRFKTHLKNVWYGKTKTSITLIILIASTLIPLGFRMYYLQRTNIDQSLMIVHSVATQTDQAQKIMDVQKGNSSFQETISYLESINEEREINGTPAPINKPLIGTCLSPDIWIAHRDEFMKKSDNCWMIPGMSLNNNELNFFVEKNAGYGTYGIYTPIEEYKKIVLELLIDDFSISYGGSYSRIMFGVVSYLNPIPENGTIFALQIERSTQDNPLLKFRLPYEMYTTSLNDYISLGNPHIISMEIENQFISLYVDGLKNSKKFRLPENPSYFWIGYTVEEGSILDAKIVNLEFQS